MPESQCGFDAAVKQILRLGVFEDFRFMGAEAQEELVTALMEASPDDGFASKLVSEWIANCLKCPTPADIRRVARTMLQNAEESTGWKPPKCAACSDTGWITTYMLITYEGEAYSFKRQDTIDRTRYDRIREELGDAIKRGEHPKQKVGTAAKPCECRTKGAAA